MNLQEAETISTTMATDNCTKLNKDLFEDEPVKRSNILAGRTALFFALKLSKKGIEQFGINDSTTSQPCFIGKEANQDGEVKFYEQVLAIKKPKDDGGMIDDGGISRILEHTFKYVGIVTLQENVNGTDESRRLLVFNSLVDSYTKPRFLDFKMGEKSGGVKWKYGFTNNTDVESISRHLSEKSRKESFRLESFTGPPKAVTTMDPQHDIQISFLRKSEDEAQSKAFQKTKVHDVLMYYLDIHEVSNETTCENMSIETAYSSSEVAEIVLHETVCKLVQLSSACHNIKVPPQKWLGSSVALGYDTDNFSLHSDISSEQRIRSNVIVSIFDWEESEILHKEAYDQMEEKEKGDRKTYWKLYVNGIDNISFHAAKRYHNQFSNSGTWNTITVRVMDYDSHTKDDFMREVIISLPKLPTLSQPIDSQTELSESCDDQTKLSGWYPLKKTNVHKENETITVTENPVGNKPCIKLDISWRSAPDKSRLKGSWRITIDQARNLPIKDMISSDPYCLVTASSKGPDGDTGYLIFEQKTSVVTNNLNPVWAETLEVPSIRCPCNFLNSLGATKVLKVDKLKLNAIFSKGESEEESKKAWAQLFQ